MVNKYVSDNDHAAAVGAIGRNSLYKLKKELDCILLREAANRFSGGSVTTGLEFFIVLT